MEKKWNEKVDFYSRTIETEAFFPFPSSLLSSLSARPHRQPAHNTLSLLPPHLPLRMMILFNVPSLACCCSILSVLPSTMTTFFYSLNHFLFTMTFLLGARCCAFFQHKKKNTRRSSSLSSAHHRPVDAPETFVVYWKQQIYDCRWGREEQSKNWNEKKKNQQKNALDEMFT